jgi:hypothetical protein
MSLPPEADSWLDDEIASLGHLVTDDDATASETTARAAAPAPGPETRPRPRAEAPRVRVRTRLASPVRVLRRARLIARARRFDIGIYSLCVALSLLTAWLVSSLAR